METYLKEDPELRRQMGALDGVSSKAAFSEWKASFLQAMMQFLDEDGSIKAEEAYRKFNKNISSLETINGKLQACVDDGGLAVDKNPSVKARKALNDLGTKLANISDALQLLLPGNKAEQVEYTNFHMGAILIREGFSSYAALEACDAHLQELKQNPALQQAADRQLIESIERYRERLRAFCTIMADLGIMRICNKAQEVKQIEDEPDPVEDLTAFTPQIEEEPPKADGPKKRWTPPPKEPKKEAAPKKRASAPAGKKALPRIKRSQSKDETLAVVAKDDEPADNTDDKSTSSAADKDNNNNTEKEEPPPKKKKPPARAKSMPNPETAEVSVTAKHKKLKALEEPDQVTAKRTIKRKKSQRPSVEPKDTTPDLERTAKPTRPKRFSTNDSRGCGRQLSKEEAKEKTKPPPRTKSMPMPKAKPMGDGNEAGDSQSQSDKKVEGKTRDAPPKKKKGGGGDNAPGNAAPAAAKGQPPPKGPTKSTTVSQEPAAPAPAAPKKDANKATITVYFVDKQKQNKIELKVDIKKDTLKSLKAMLEPKTGLKPEQQRICLRFLGNELTGPKPLSFYSIKDESELDLDPKTISLLVQVPNKTFTLEGVDPNKDTIDQLKARIEQESSLAAARQSLYFKDKELPPKKTVKEMGIPNGGQIKVELYAKVPITIHIVLENRKLELMVDTTKDKLEDVKALIETKTKVPKDNQQLFSSKDCKEELGGGSGGGGDSNGKKKKSLLKSMSFGKRSSSASKKTFIRDFGIQEGSELFMQPKVIKVTIVMPDGKSFKPQLPPSSDMSVVIKALAELTKNKDLAGKNPVLKFGDKALEKGKTLKDAGMREGSKVKLELTK